MLCRGFYAARATPNYLDFLAAVAHKARSIGDMSLSLFRKPLAYVAFLFPIVIVIENKLTAVFLLAMSRLSLSRMARAAGASAATAASIIGQLSFSAWRSRWLCT